MNSYKDVDCRKLILETTFPNWTILQFLLNRPLPVIDNQMFHRTWGVILTAHPRRLKIVVGAPGMEDHITGVHFVTTLTQTRTHMQTKWTLIKLANALRGVRRNMKGGFQTWKRILLINIHDIHTSIRRFVSQICGVLISRGIGTESPMLRLKVWILHADTWINTRTIILNLIFSGSDSLMTPHVKYVHVLKHWVIMACSFLNSSVQMPYASY